MKVLMGHDWQGGVRELENVIERAVIFAAEDMIRVDNLSEHIRGDAMPHGYPDSLKMRLPDLNANIFYE